MSEYIIVWDIETVPDLEAICRIHNLTDEAAAIEALGDKFPKHPLHKIICIGAVIAQRTNDYWVVTAIGAPTIGDRSEKALIEAFADKIAELRPCLVSFNGHGFDLPVLRYRAMLNCISAPALENKAYFNRYGSDSIDLCDVLSSYSSQSKSKLHDLCRTMSLPGKPEDIDGSQVAEYFAAGRLQEISNYCECDVISTYRLWLRYDLFRGRLTQKQHELSERQLTDFISIRLAEKPHWNFLINPAH